MDAQCDKLAFIVSRTCDGQSPTDDLGQFVTLNVILCVQHDAHETAGCAGLYSTADICVLTLKFEEHISIRILDILSFL